MGNDDHGELAVERRLELLAGADAGRHGHREGLEHRTLLIRHGELQERRERWGSSVSENKDDVSRKKAAKIL